MIVACALCLTVVCVDEQAEIAKAILSAYMSNVGPMSRHCVIRFEIVEGPVEGKQHFAQEDLSRVPWVRRTRLKGEYVLNGARVLVEHVVSNDELLRNRLRVSGDTHQYYLDSYRALTDGATTLIDFPGLAPDNVTEIHTAKLENAELRRGDFDIVPLSLGIATRSDYDLRAVLEGRIASPMAWKLQSIQDVSVDGRALLKLEFLGKYENRLVYWIDLEAGAIPRRIRWIDPDGGFYEGLDHDDIRRVDGFGWYPFRETFYHVVGRSENFRVHEQVVTDVDFTTPPPVERFRLEFPKPVYLIHNQRLAVNGPRAVWDLDSLSPKSLAVGRSFKPTEAVSRGPTLPAARPDEPWWIIPLSVIVLGLAAAAGLFIWRRSRHAA